jgi:hypothetical protein
MPGMQAGIAGDGSRGRRECKQVSPGMNRLSPLFSGMKGGRGSGHLAIGSSDHRAIQRHNLTTDDIDGTDSAARIWEFIMRDFNQGDEGDRGCRRCRSGRAAMLAANSSVSRARGTLSFKERIGIPRCARDFRKTVQDFRKQFGKG